MQRELPVVLDLLGVAVGAGCTPYLAIEVTVALGAARSRGALRAGAPGAAGSAPPSPTRSTSWRRTTPSLRPSSTRCSRPSGSARRSARRWPGSPTRSGPTSRRRAEAHARRVPVRLLFPLVFLVLPAFGLLTVVPALLSGLART